MFCKNITNVKNILVTSSIYDKIDKLDKVMKLIDNYDYVIINGNVCYPDDGYVLDRLQQIDNYLANNKIIYVAGQYDYQLMVTNNAVYQWIKNKPNVVNVKFMRGTSLIVVNGGIPINMPREALESNLKITFCSKEGGVAWHHKYNGKLGYVISNNPLSNQPPEFFNYSARLGVKFSKNNKIYLQEANENGLQKTFVL